MDEINLNSIRSLRNLVAELNSSDIDELISKLTQIRDEKIEAEQNVRAKQAERQAYAQQILASLKEHSMSPEDLLTASQALEQRPRRNIKPKYRYYDAEGVECLWSGQGKTPRKFIEAMQRENKDKEAYRIPENN